MKFGNKNLKIALIISLAIHAGAIFLPRVKLFLAEIKTRDTQVTYLIKKEHDPLELKKTLPKREATLREKRQLQHSLDSQPGRPRELAPEALKKQFLKTYSDFLKMKPQLYKPDVIAVKKRIALKPVELNKINSPSYISYYQIVREKIRRCAYQNYSSEETGEIYLSFLIASDGKLAQAKVIEEKSTLSPYLREMALKSVKDASSFPAFPKDLNYKQLSFNVIISFEID